MNTSAKTIALVLVKVVAKNLAVIVVQILAAILVTEVANTVVTEDNPINNHFRGEIKYTFLPCKINCQL